VKISKIYYVDVRYVSQWFYLSVRVLLQFQIFLIACILQVNLVRNFKISKFSLVGPSYNYE